MTSCSPIGEGCSTRRTTARKSKPIADAVVAALRAGKKVLWCGNGGSAAEAQHMAAELSGRFLRERPGLHSEALSVNSSTLTCVGNDYGYDHVFSRQVEAFAHPGDVVIGMTTSGTSRNVVLALEAAKQAGRGDRRIHRQRRRPGCRNRRPFRDRARWLRRDRSRSAPSHGAYRLRPRRTAPDLRRAGFGDAR